MSKLSRRGFLLGSAAAGTLAGCKAVGLGNGSVDPNLTAFLSDIHVSGRNVRGTIWGDLGGRPVKALLAESKFAAGYIHGHRHKWMTNWFMKSYGDRRIVRTAGLPSTGWWGDIGFATLRTFADRAELAMAPDNDFFFPNPLKPGEVRPAVWDEIRAEHANARCTFTYG